MLRSDGLLLAYLVLQRHPELRGSVRRVVRAMPGQEQLSMSLVGQGLIRAKVVSPKEFLACRTTIEAARRRCVSCRRPFVLMPALQPKTRRCKCGHRNVVPAAPPELGPATLFDSETPQPIRRDDSGAKGRSSGRKQRESGRKARGKKRNSRRAARAGSRRAETLPEPEEYEDASDQTKVSPRTIGPYPIVGRIGDGGMGIIFRARDGAGREVALKLLRQGTSDESKTRFRREAEALARLSHPHIVQVHDVGADRDGRPYFTMELVEGRELQEIRHELARESFLEIIAKVAEGLHHAHEQGIIHRDIKPHNIMVDAKGEPRVADFGLARDLGRSSLTEAGDLVGTPLFMAPEQLRGDPSEIDRRTDIYALGVVLYEGLTRQLPIEASNFYELQEQIRTRTPDPPSSIVPGIPEVIDRIVLKALNKRAEDRYQTAEELARDLRRFLAGESVDVRPVSAVVRVTREVWGLLGSPWGAAAVIVVFLAVGLGGWYLVQARRDRIEAAARAALKARQDACTKLIAQAQTAVQEAHRKLDSGERPAAAELAKRAVGLIERAELEASELGDDAPKQVASEAGTIRIAAERVRARTLADGSPQERDQARILYRDLAKRASADLDIRMALGRLELEAGHVKPAAVHFNAILQREEGRLEAYYLRAETHRIAGDPHYAVFDYERALGTGTDPADANRRARALAGRARARLLQGKVEDAKADLAEAQRIDPREPTVRLARAEFYRRTGEPETALRELVFAVRAFPQDPRVHLACGKAWAVVGDRERAGKQLELALAGTHTADAWLARGRLRALSGDDAGAASDLKQALARSEPQDPIRPAIHLIRARHLRTQGKLEKALSTLAELIEVERRDAPPSEALLERAELRIIRRVGTDLSLAERDVRTVLGRQENDPRALRAWIRISLLRRDQAHAMTLVERLLNKHPDDAAGLTLKAQLLRAQEQPSAELESRAAAAQRRLLRRPAGLHPRIGDPTREALAALALGRRARYRATRLKVIHQRKAKLDEASLQLGRAVGLAPWLAPARVARAVVLLDRRKWDAALEELDAALLSGSGTERVHTLRGTLLAAADRHKPALEAFQAALRLSNKGRQSAARKDRRARLLLARARSRVAVGLLEEARADLDQAVLLEPTLLEGFEQRAKLRSRAGDSAGADKDRERVQLLRQGYVRIYRETRRKAWQLALGREGDHIHAARTLRPMFELISRRRDPVRRADLHLVRAYMRVRSLKMAESLNDLAALLELGPRSFRHLYDEIITFRGKSGVGLNVERILDRLEARVHDQRDVDPDFLLGFSAFVHLEFGGTDPIGEKRLRSGIAALDRYLDRHAAHPAALLLRAVLLLRDQRVAESLGSVVAALEDPRPPGFAHYVLSRIQATQRDRAGALRSLATALSAGFDVYERIKTDPALADLRQDPRFKLLLERSQGAGYLAQIDRAEELAVQARRGRRRRLYSEALRSATAGLGYLRKQVQAKKLPALRLAGQLYLARARQAARLGKPHPARRDLAAALEANPGLCLDYDQLRAACAAVAPLNAATFRGARPLGDEPLPTQLRLALPVVLALLTGAEPPPEEVERARTLVERADAPRLRIFLPVIRLAQRAPDDALEQGRRAVLADSSLAPLAAWFEARVHASRGEPKRALEALRKAYRGGLRGWLAKDPGLASLKRSRDFQRLFRGGLSERKRWRDR